MAHAYEVLPYHCHCHQNVHVLRCINIWQTPSQAPTTREQILHLEEIGDRIDVRKPQCIALRAVDGAQHARQQKDRQNARNRLAHHRAISLADPHSRQLPRRLLQSQITVMHSHCIHTAITICIHTAITICTAPAAS